MERNGGEAVAAIGMPVRRTRSSGSLRILARHERVDDYDAAFRAKVLDAPGGESETAGFGLGASSGLAGASFCWRSMGGLPGGATKFTPCNQG